MISSTPGVNQMAAAAASATGATSSTDELRNNFMTMLVTQLKNQDPLNPLENNELTAQLAQINTVSGIDSLNDTLDGITAQIEAGQSLQATALIGRGVLVPGNRLLVGEEGASTPFGVELDQPAENVTAKIIGSDGQVVSTLELESLQAGVNTINWDGQLADGGNATPGAYRVQLEMPEGSEPVEMTALNYAVVSGVSTSDGEPRLDLGGISDPVGLDRVRQIL